MIDIRYHIATIIAVFLALGLGILIGSSLVGDNLMVDQQNKMIERLEEQFDVLKDREALLVADNEYKGQMISNYENYSQALVPAVVTGRLDGYNVAVVVTGDSEIPAGMINALSIAGAQVVSKTVVLSNMSLNNKDIRTQVQGFYGMDEKMTPIEMRQHIADSVAAVIMNQSDENTIDFLQRSELVKFSGGNDLPVDSVVIVGGANNLNSFYAADFDSRLITNLNQQVRAYGVESVDVEFSCMDIYQSLNISTIDNINRSPGQVSLVLAMEGESGNYGVKETASKFMPTIPVEYEI